MASTKTPSARELRKKKTVRIVAVVACAALLLTAVMPYIASALYCSQRPKKRRFQSFGSGIF